MRSLVESFAGLENETHEKQLSQNHQVFDCADGDMSRRQLHVQRAASVCRRNAGCASPRLSF
jgi:hypothetical protein